MNGFDIILGIPLLYAAYRGFREGIIVQLGGIAGLFIGVYFAFRHSSAVGQWLHTDPPIAAAVGFVVILLAVLLVMALLGHLIKGIFKLAGLGPIDAIGGILLGVFKMAVILSLFLYAFETVNSTTRWVENDRYTEAALYKPVRSTTALLFPYLDLMKNKITGNND